MAQKFYILAVTGDQHQFVKVDAEMVDIGEEIPAFAYNSQGHGNPLEFWNIFDLASGWRLCKTYATKDEAIKNVSRRVAEAGKGRYLVLQKLKLDLYGKSPAVEA